MKKTKWWRNLPVDIRINQLLRTWKAFAPINCKIPKGYLNRNSK
jgi:hypothetical protein